jgi:hypothetical protein
MHGYIEYNASLFEQTTATGLVRECNEILAAAVQDPDQKISTVVGSG